MPSILFRADAEESIGVGDLMSVIYLSRKFQKQLWKCFFVVKDYPPALKIIDQHKLSNLYLIPADISLSQEIDFIKKICRDKPIDCLLMEVTKNSLDRYKALGKPSPIKACVNFDGVITEDFDIVVNWCIDSSDGLYRTYPSKDIKFILGFENTILPDYLDWQKIHGRSFSKEVKKILISMGGVDEFDLSTRIIEALSPRIDDYEIRVVTGPGYLKQKDLYKYIDSEFGHFTLKEAVGDLFEDYLWADLAFSAGGLTSSELVATKTPAILVACYEHQINRCKYYSERNWAYYTGYYQEVNEENIIKSLDYVINNISRFRDSLWQSDFRGGNEKIFKSVDSYRQSKQLV